MGQDPYRDFAQIYNDWQLLYTKPFSLSLAPKIRAAVRAHGAPCNVLADAACGTGIFAHHWQQTYPTWTVYGADRSAEMIREAQRAQGARNRGPRQRPAFLVQDLKRLTLPEPAGVITCIFDSLNHLTRQWDLLQAFRRISSALAPGGLLIFDLIDELTFPEVFTGTSIVEGENLYLGMETEYTEERGIGYGHARFVFFRRSGPGWKRVEVRIRERRWFRGEVRDLLLGAGLDLIRLERIDPYESSDFLVPRTFWICRRPR